MYRRIVLLSLISLTSFVLFLASCTKFDTTSIGSDLIPEVDNVNTFADTVDITTTQGVFDGLYKDTTRLTQSEEYVLGKVSTDAIGETNATLCLQMKPTFYPYFIGKMAKDTILQADSVVLCLSYKSFWGDSTVPLKLQVFEVEGDVRGKWDSVYSPFVNGTIFNNINYAPSFEPTPLSDPKTIDIRRLGDLVHISKGRDSVINQIRIKLSDAFRDRLFGFDSLNTGNKIFRADSLFRGHLNGFGIVATEGNALVYLNLLEDNTRLELHYKKKNAGVTDTVFNSFYFFPEESGNPIPPSSIANQILRNRNPLPTGDQELWLQTNPGTFATLHMPELDTMQNRIIHRAELQIQQIRDPINDQVFTEPPFLYLDLEDSVANQWKPIYIDLNPGDYYNPDITDKVHDIFFPYSGVDVSYFGGNMKRKPDGSAYYNINISRHIQRIVTKHTRNYKLRLFAAHSFTYPQCDTLINSRTKHVQISYRNPIAYGRVKVGGGSNSIPAYRMRLRIIYSRVK